MKNKGQCCEAMVNSLCGSKSPVARIPSRPITERGFLPFSVPIIQPLLLTIYGFSCSFPGVTAVSFFKSRSSQVLEELLEEIGVLGL